LWRATSPFRSARKSFDSPARQGDPLRNSGKKRRVRGPPATSVSGKGRGRNGKPRAPAEPVVTVEVAADVEEGTARLVGGVGDRPTAVHVEHEGEHALAAGLVEVPAELRQRDALRPREGEQLVRIEEQAPVAVAEFREEAVDPVHPEIGGGEGPLRREDMAIRLAQQELPRAVGRAVVGDEEAVRSEAAVVLEEVGQARGLVADGHEDAALPRARGHRDRVQPDQAAIGHRLCSGFSRRSQVRARP
jgi:hypothetical protein